MEPFTIFPTTAFTATVNTREFLTGSAFYLVVVTGTRSGTITLLPTLQMKLPDGTYLPIEPVANAIAAAGTAVYIFGSPVDVANVANETQITEGHPCILPRYCRFALIAAGTGSFDVTVHVIPA